LWLPTLTNIIRVIESQRIRWGGHAVFMEHRRHEEKEDLQDLGADDRIILTF
jgi:hypothetical protein